MYSVVLLMALTAPQSAPTCGCRPAPVCGCYGYAGAYSGCGGYVMAPTYYGCCGPVMMYSSPPMIMDAPKVIIPDKDKKITPDKDEDKGKKITPDKDKDEDKDKKITPDKDDKKQDDKKDDKKNPPDKNVAAEAPALVLVSLPADATLIFNGQPTKTQLSERRFVSPPLRKGFSYSYSVQATVVRDGTPRILTRTIDVEAGKTSRVTFTFPEAPSVASK